MLEFGGFKLTDFEKLKKTYNFGRNLRFSDILVLLKSAKRKSYEPGAVFIMEGHQKRELFFIQKGLVRTFAVNDKGDEITTMIWRENQVLGDPDIIFFNLPSRFTYQTLEPTVVFSIDYELLQSIIRDNLKLQENRKNTLHYILREMFQRVESFVLLSPEERYIQFVESNPDIIQRVPGKYIANILGITPVSLSRIRKRIALKKKKS